LRLATLSTPYGLRVAAYEPDGLLDLQATHVLSLRATPATIDRTVERAAIELPADLMRFLDAGAPALATAREALAFGRGLSRGAPPWSAHATATLGPAVPRPGKLVILRGNYLKHRVEMAPRLGTSVERPDRPRYFMKPASAVIGHGESIVHPALSSDVQHEVELAVVIGRPCRRVVVEHALEYVAGYTILLDMTARDLSGKDDRNKSFDTFAPIGPCLATPDEVGDPHRLALSLRVNGAIRQQGSTSALEFRVEELIAFLSEAMTLLPGDVISTGTPEGVGPVKPGDVIEAEIERIGVLRCPVVAETA